MLDWEPIGEGVRVTTDRDVYEADRLVITAGAWNNTLLDCLDGLIEPGYAEMLRKNVEVGEGEYAAIAVFR